MEEEELKRGFLFSTVSSAECCSVEVLEQNVTARGVEIYVSFSRVSSLPACLGSRWQALARAGGKTWKRRDCSASRERERGTASRTIETHARIRPISGRPSFSSTSSSSSPPSLEPALTVADNEILDATKSVRPRSPFSPALSSLTE